MLATANYLNTLALLLNALIFRCHRFEVNGIHNFIIGLVTRQGLAYHMLSLLFNITEKFEVDQLLRACHEIKLVLLR